MSPSHPSERWRCDHSPGDFSHIFWSCPAITGFWSEVLFVIRVSVTKISSSMEFCILDLVENLIPIAAERTPVGLLFYARKAIALYWKKQVPPSIFFWKSLVNNSVPLYKDTYVNRGCLSQYDGLNG